MKITCPACQSEHDFEIVAEMAGEHAIGLKLSPNPGERLSPFHVGGMMRSFQRLLVGIGKDAGFKSTVVLREMFMEDDGSVVIKVMVLRVADAPQ